MKRLGRVIAPFLTCFAIGAPLSGAMAAADFASAVTEVLMNQTDGPLSEMSGDQKQAMIECVIGVLSELPDGKKDYIVEGSDAEAREDRFGEVVMENHAEWKQKIAQGCGDLAT